MSQSFQGTETLTTFNTFKLLLDSNIAKIFQVLLILKYLLLCRLGRWVAPEPNLALCSYLQLTQRFFEYTIASFVWFAQINILSRRNMLTFKLIKITESQPLFNWKLCNVACVEFWVNNEANFVQLPVEIANYCGSQSPASSNWTDIWSYRYNGCDDLIAVAPLTKCQDLSERWKGSFCGRHLGIVLTNLTQPLFLHHCFGNNLCFFFLSIQRSSTTIAELGWL